MAWNTGAGATTQAFVKPLSTQTNINKTSPVLTGSVDQTIYTVTAGKTLYITGFVCSFDTAGPVRMKLKNGADYVFDHDWLASEGTISVGNFTSPMISVAAGAVVAGWCNGVAGHISIAGWEE